MQNDQDIKSGFCAMDDHSRSFNDSNGTSIKANHVNLDDLCLS